MGACLAHTEQKRKGQATQAIIQTHIECHICARNIRSNNQTILSCGHSFCKSCLSETYSEKIKQRNLDIKCPDCMLLLEYNKISEIVTPEIFALYDKTCLMNSLILAENIFFCPTADCLGIYQIIPSEFRYFDCRFCKKQFCLICHAPYHGKTEHPFEQQGTPQGTVICPNPKCRKPGVKNKNEGCNIIQCKICKLEYCYDCGGTKCTHFKCINKKA